MNRAIRRLAYTCPLSLLPAFFGQADQVPAVPDLDERISGFKAQRPAPAARQRAVMDKAAKGPAAAMPGSGEAR